MCKGQPHLHNLLLNYNTLFKNTWYKYKLHSHLPVAICNVIKWSESNRKGLGTTLWKQDPPKVGAQLGLTKRGEALCIPFEVFVQVQTKEIQKLYRLNRQFRLDFLWTGVKNGSNSHQAIARRERVYTKEDLY